MERETVIRRGQVWDAMLSPAQGSEQAGSRPVVVVTRDAVNASSPVVVAIPLTRAVHKRRIYPSHVMIRAPEGGLTEDSVALCEQIRAISKTRLARLRGEVGPEVMEAICRAIAIVVDCEAAGQ